MVSCEAQCLPVATNVWHTVECYTCSICRHWWSLDQIVAVSKMQRDPVYPALFFAVCGVPTCLSCTPSLRVAVEVWLFQKTPGRVRQAHHMFGCCPPHQVPGDGRCMVHIKDIFPELSFWNWWLVSSFTALSQSTWSRQPLKSCFYIAVSSSLLGIGQEVSWHMTQSITYQWSFFPTRGHRHHVIFGLSYFRILLMVAIGNPRLLD